MNGEQQHKKLEELIRSAFKGMSERVYHELLAEAYIYLDDKDLSVDSISDQKRDELINYLRIFLKKQMAEIAGETFLGRRAVVPISRLATEFTEGKSDDEILSAALLTIKSKSYGSRQEEEENEEEILKSMEARRDQLQQSISPFEFEALKIKTSNEVEKEPHLTAGFDNLGLYILFRRARIRMMWFEKEVD